jgi:hypothetical protein
LSLLKYFLDKLLYLLQSSANQGFATSRRKLGLFFLSQSPVFIIRQRARLTSGNRFYPPLPCDTACLCESARTDLPGSRPNLVIERSLSWPT